MNKKPSNPPNRVEIAVILPSRGLLFSQSFEELLRELKPFEYRIFFAHGLPIPDCFNVPLEKALSFKNWTHILFAEDDMALPKGVLKKMVGLKVPATALDYPFKDDNEATILHTPDGRALFSGTGFILVERWVLDKIPKPVFRTDLAWDMQIKQGKLTVWPRDVSKIKTYGLHDISFGILLYTNGLAIVPAAPAGQRKLINWGKPNVNKGAHNIRTLTKVLKDNITKTNNGVNTEKWIKAIRTVKTVEVLDHIPKHITYKNGQAVLKKGEYEVV